jgi:ABC-2 type transport system permease protein
VLRFWKVAFQTVAAPVLTAMMYLLIFGHVLEDRVQVFQGVGYTSFLIPGLVMMSVLQNAFANSSSSLIQSKVTGNLVFLLVTPLSHGSLVRGLRGGVDGARPGGRQRRAAGHRVVRAAAPGRARLDAGLCALGAGMLGTLGLIAGLWAEKFDQLAAFQNFVIMPMTFLSGVFYSVHSLPAHWQQASHLNPFFYMIDGFRRGFFGASDVSPWTSLAVVAASLAVVSAIALHLLRSGYKLRH